MENKKTIVAMIVIILLIIGLVVVSYFYNDFNKRQMTLLTREANRILETDLVDDDINLTIKTSENYAKVEKSIKEYIVKLKNIYVEMEEMASGINPNTIFTAQNMPEKNMDGIDKIIKQYKEKCQNFIVEYDELITEEKIHENITEAGISVRQDYYIKLYNEVMLSETMQKKYLNLEEEVKNQKGRVYEKLNKIEKMKEYLEEYKDDWTIKEDKVHFTSNYRLTEYYALFNQIVD